MEIFSIIGVALVGTALTILLRQYKPEYAMMISLGCGILLFLMTLRNLLPIFTAVTELMDRVDVSGTYASAIIKALGICYVVQLAADTCRDAGETALAGKVELCGKVVVVVLAFPLFENLLQIALSLIQV